MEKAVKSQTFFIVLSVLYVITGVVILVWPNLTMPLLGKALGIGMLVVGCTHMILYFTRDHLQSILHMDLTIGVVFAAFGAFMLMHADFVEMVLPFAAGILLLIGAMTKIQYSLDLRMMHVKHWKIMLALAVILIGTGITLLYNPFKGNVLIYVIAASLIAEGILNIFCVLFVSHRMKQIQRGKVPAGPYVPARKGGPDGIGLQGSQVRPDVKPEDILDAPSLPANKEQE